MPCLLKKLRKPVPKRCPQHNQSHRFVGRSYLVKEGFESERKREKQTGERRQIQEENRKKVDCRSYYI